MSSLTHLHGFRLVVLLPWLIEITFFICANRINLLNLKVKFSQLVIAAKGILKLPNLHILIKQKGPSIPRNLTLETFGKLLTVFSIKLNLLFLLYPKVQWCCLLHLISKNYLLKSFSKNSNLFYSGIYLLVFPSRTSLKLHISVTPKLVKKFIMKFDSSKVCGPHCIAVVILNCGPELSYIQNELFNGQVHEYHPIFEGMVAKLTVTNNLSIIFKSKQNSGKYSVWWLSKQINLKLFWKMSNKSSVKAKILENIPGKKMITNKRGFKFCKMIKPLITFFKICCFKQGRKKGLYLKNLVHLWVQISKNGLIVTFSILKISIFNL